MPRYSFNNIIIIVTNVIILEPLCAQFVHPGAPQGTILFSHELEHKTIESLQTSKKLFFLATMTSELSKYLNEQLGASLNVKEQK